MKKCFIKSSLCYSVLICVFLVSSNWVIAQTSYTKKVNVIVSDEMNGSITAIDTILPNQAMADRFLRLKGYDNAGINRASSESKGQRKINVRVREVLESEYYDVQTGKVNLDKFIKIPPGAKVREVDGLKEIEWVETDAYGNMTARSATVRTGERKHQPHHTATYEIVGPDNKVKIGTDTAENTELLKEMSSVTVNPTVKIYPKFTVTVATTDIFDLNTLDEKADWLQMARELNVENFMVKPDYDKGEFLFKFDLAEVAEDTKMEIFDIVGFPVYSEDLSSLSGTYSKFLPDFNLYKRGTYLVMITQKITSQKFTQKVIIE